MKLRNIFESYTKDELKMICRNLDLSGYVKLDKPGLVELLYQSMNNHQFFKELLGSVSDSCLFVLSLIAKSGKKGAVDKAKSSQIPNFSRQAFYNSLKKLYTISTIFMGEDEKGNGYFIIPDDLVWIKDVLVEIQITLVSKLVEIEKELPCHT
jgi:hypothetical protein